MKRALLFALALAAGALHVSAQLPAWSEDAQKAWWTANPTLEKESVAAGALQQQLALDYDKNGSAVFGQPDFQDWLDLLVWIKTGVESVQVLKDPANFAAFVSIGNDNRVMHEFVEKLRPADKQPAALAILIHLAQANMADLHDYAALGTAYALVFDVPFPKDWPHSQVAQSAVPIGDLDPVARFQFYVAANKAHTLDLDISQLSFENLRFLVDSEVNLSELQWGQANTTTIPYTHFADAFFSIEYTTMRLSNSNGYDWPLKTYRLQDIKQAGGICVDQAYYACMAGKSRGIPTVYLSGQGDEGGHAWFGYLDRSGAWELDCGRYEEQNYAKGYTRDPQDWSELKDTDLLQATQYGPNDPAYPAAHTALIWARLRWKDAAAKQAYEDAHTLMPKLAEAWHAEADYLDLVDASIDDQKAFYQEWISQMAPFPDQKVAAQRRLVAVLRKAGDASADSVEQDIILQNRTGGIDLAVDGAISEIDDHLKVRDFDGARMSFERSVRDFSDNGGGTFFFRVVEPYIYKCWTYGQVAQAGKGLEFTDDRTQLDKPGWQGGNPISNAFDAMKKQQAEIEQGLAAAQNWLGELDNGQAQQAWGETASDSEVHATPIDAWAKKVGDDRTKAGDMTTRAIKSVTLYPKIETNGEQHAGPFLLAQFVTSFDSATLDETVVVRQTGERTWQVYAYESKPGVPLPAPPTADATNP